MNGVACSRMVAMNSPLNAIGSMATRHVLAELLRDFEVHSAQPVHLESVGGVDAARRVQDGETFDVVLLAADAIDKLLAHGAAVGAGVAGSRVDIVRSPMAVAVASHAGQAAPDIATEAALLTAVLAAPSLAYSTGPSGSHLLRLFERWGVLQAVQPRLVQAPPGVPVAALVARGDATLGFQQLSELLGQPGVQVLGELPPGADFITTFSGALCRTGTRPDAARQLLAFLAAPRTAATKQRHGMQPA